MTSRAEGSNYSISLPANTNPEVLEWFEFIQTHGDLSLEVINLVQNYINNNQFGNPQDFSQPDINVNTIPDQDDLLASLYNYDGAASAIFCEEKKAKKKMLSV